MCLMPDNLPSKQKSNNFINLDYNIKLNMINYYLNAILISNTHTTLNLKIATKVMLTKSTSLDSFIHNSNFNQLEWVYVLLSLN